MIGERAEPPYIAYIAYIAMIEAMGGGNTRGVGMGGIHKELMPYKELPP